MLLAIAAGSAVAAPAVEPTGASSVAAWQVMTIFGYLGLLGMLAFFGVRWWKARQGSPSATGPRIRQINVVEVRRVSPSTSIVLADIKGRSYIIVCSGSSVAIQATLETSA
ncbi:hypothetical protein D0B54_04985 [Solimonas sp. K1W22B-7]|uniref:hypothetical protein n=1 Tax=Solimonas sp. K1W22B-7 TaxID=2303331 RepID=UPI000E331D2E|nr:hypothetical protein [Solimonas sp. K1W22B-7]AXQ28068.1 hypothetical protein D0B54_04985 [Solimonas sp. K1W22B-7]